MAQDKVVGRRRHGDEFRARVLAECGRPGASVAQVARAHGLHASVVHGWRKLARGGSLVAVTAARGFVSVPLQPAPAATPVAPCIAMHLQRGELGLMLSWPVAAAGELAAWTRQVLLGAGGAAHDQN
jgi:transposase